MSRFVLSSVVLLSLSTSAFATRFATPPPSADASAPSAPAQGAPARPRHIESDAIDTNIGIRAELAPPSRADVRTALAKLRAQNLAAFRAYYKAGVYPDNVYSKKTLNVWRDEAGHFCAAATIMVKSGNAALAIRMAEDNNFIKLGEVKQGPVMDWILSSGFTQAELALIQRPFSPVVKRPMPQPIETTPIVVDAKLRKAETARLLALYKQIDKQLVANQKKSLERAVDTVMANPDLAWKLVGAASV